MAEHIRVLGEHYTEAQAIYPGTFNGQPEFSLRQQPLHTLYGGAHLFRPDSIQKLNKLIERYFRQYIKSPASISILLSEGALHEDGMRGHEVAEELYSLIERKILAGAIEDYRIDFEDGYGYHSNAEEDETAISSAKHAAEAYKAGTTPSFFGFRIKAFSGTTRKRALDTLDIFLSEFLDQSGNELPENFIVTLPKIETIEEIDSFNETLAEFEFRAGLKRDSLKTELMLEEPSVLTDRDGQSQIPKILAATGDRCLGLHIGIYDFLSALQVPAVFQQYDHPLADDLRIKLVHATHNSPLSIVDGVTNILPIEIHRSKSLSADEIDENMASVYNGWSAHIHNVQHSLKFGIWQGWDIHPAQFIARAIAVYRHLLEAKHDALNRMQRFMQIATMPNQSGGVFDDAATIRGLLVYLKRCRSLGIVTDAELEASGLSKEQLASGKILMPSVGSGSK